MNRSPWLSHDAGQRWLLTVTLRAALLVTVALAGFGSSGCGSSQDSEGIYVPTDAVGADSADAPSPDAASFQHDAWTPVCTPGESVCERLQRKVCSEDGAGWRLISCPPGSGCVEGGVCELAHPRVVFIFDTSSSMLAQLDGDGGGFDPACGSIGEPGTRLEASKALFRVLFAEALPTAPWMSLFRFPQRPMVQSGCGPAAHTGWSRMTGDEGAHEAPEGRGEWFRLNLRESMVAPFPTTLGDDGRDAIVRWLDGVEDVVETVQTCTSSPECEDGFCHAGTCYRYVDAELRARGPTPLGRTMFYAGEYFRTVILADGRRCTHDGECGSPGYRCGDDGRCFDPLASCRTNHIVIFSDGHDTVDTPPDSFFHPRNQARRLRFGLGCVSDADCLGGGSCSASGSCQPAGDVPETIAARIPEDEGLMASLDFVDPEGVQHLTRLDGARASVQVHVLDVWGDEEDRLLAWLGGGEYVTGTLDDPNAVLHEMNLLFRSKGEEAICVPLD